MDPLIFGHRQEGPTHSSWFKFTRDLLLRHPGQAVERTQFNSPYRMDIRRQPYKLSPSIFNNLPWRSDFVLQDDQAIRGAFLEKQQKFLVGLKQELPSSDG